MIVPQIKCLMDMDSWLTQQKQTQDDKSIPPKIIKVLCSGVAYQIACDAFLNPKRLDTTVDSLLLEDEISECFFLDTLMAHGYLSVPKRLAQNAKEMVVDTLPFYEVYLNF